MTDPRQTFRGAFSPASKNRLTRHDLDRFAGRTLFDRIARAVCRAECLPRKELYEAWETARRVRRIFRGGRVVDLAGGHGLAGQMLLILDDSPRLAGRVAFKVGQMDEVALQETDLVVSVHACGALTDVVIDRAIAAR